MAVHHRSLGRRPLVVLVLGFVLVSCAGRSTDVSTAAPPGASPATTAGADRQLDERGLAETCDDAPVGTNCGVTGAELRDLNLRYAERLEFDGDLDRAATTLGAARTRLAPLAASADDPSEADLEQVLRGLGPVQTSSNAVRTAGTAFALEVDGGCVFGSINRGELRVEIGGYVRDGGCLASYGH